MQRLSRRLQAGIRLLRAPLPVSQRLPLREAFRPSIREKQRERTGLPRSASNTRALRSRLYAGGRYVHVAGRMDLLTGHVPFGHSVTAACAVCAMTAFCRRFRCLDQTLRSWLLTAVCGWQSSTPPRGGLTFLTEEASLSRQLRTASLPTPHVPVGNRW